MIKHLFQRLMLGETIPVKTAERPKATFGLSLDRDGHRIIVRGKHLDGYIPLSERLNKSDIENECSKFDEIIEE